MMEKTGVCNSIELRLRLLIPIEGLKVKVLRDTSVVDGDFYITISLFGSSASCVLSECEYLKHGFDFVPLLFRSLLHEMIK